MKTKYLYAILASIICNQVLALEDVKNQEGDNPSFSQLDANKDQLISRDEAFKDEFVSKLWDKLDKDSDGSLDVKEFSNLPSEEKRLREIETDHPQKVQQYENGKYIPPSQQINKNK